jgi:formylglycine-generating enzyme required for sulfatase activity/rhodanese-related sulfurtransferase/chromosome segregation ATPase
MFAAKKAKIDKRILHDLVPLNALSESRFGKIAEKILVEEVKSGNYLFRKGDRDGKSVYLLDGKISLIDGFRNVTGEVQAGTDMARYPIANLQPRALSARAAMKCVVARIDSNLLDVFLSCDQTQTADVVEIDGVDTGDWMTRVLQSEVFSRLPPAKIQSLLMKMKPFSLPAGEIVISQGDEGDYFYTIHEGRCVVTRRETPDGEDLLLAELSEGDSFGEDALVTNTRRNATVTMLTDGILMRLAKQDFTVLLKKQLVRHIDRKTAYAMVEEGAVWLDVRTPEEYERGCFEDSVNIPLACLREELSELVFNATYILCCDMGGRSGAAAFMLSHKGFDVYVLEGGFAALTPADLEAAGMPLQHEGCDETIEAGKDHADAEVINFETEGRDPVTAENTATVTVTDASASIQSPVGMGDEQSGLTQEQLGLLAELQQEKKSLLEEIETYRNKEHRLTEQLELLRAELGEAGEKMGVLYSQARTDTEEKQLLRDQHAALQAEFDELQLAHESKQEETGRRIDELESHLANISQESQAGSDTLKNELEDLRANNIRLSEELSAATERAGLLDSQLASAQEAESERESETANSLQEQQDYVQQLQGEIERLGEANAQLQQNLADTSEQEKTTRSELQNQLREMQDRFTGLSGELEDVRKELESKDAALVAESARGQELDQDNQELRSSLEAAQHSISQLQAESGSTEREQQDHLQQLRAELAGKMEANEQLRQELGLAVTERNKIREELQARLDEVGGHATLADEEIADLRRRLGESADRLAAEKEQGEKLHKQNNEQARMLETLQAEIDAEKAGNETLSAAAREKQQALESELDEIRHELAGVTEHSLETASSLENASCTIQALEQEQATLKAALQEAEASLTTQSEHVATLEQDKQEALNALSTQGAATDAERRKLADELEMVQQANTQLQADLDSRLEEYHEERQRLQAELEQQQARNMALLEEHETRLSALQEAKTKSEATVQTLHAEQQELQQKYAAEQEENAGLLARIAELDEKHEAEAADKDRQVTELQASFQIAQEETGSLRQLVEEKTTRLEALQREISEREENRRLIEEQLESSRGQNNQLRLEMEQYEQHARESEAEYQESIRKAHDDLTRKNDNERELQGQIDRLRKQLEQATLDQHKQRESAQGDLDHLREQLHAERRARAEERADMAARQRELKQQLAGIATAHEANLGKHSGDLEQARDAIRAEEQERLRKVLETQAQTEDQILRLEQELSRAHEEISELTLQQKNARRVDAELLQEQNQQAISTIAQLESQLRQLSDERDSALQEQNDLHERMNALRGEVEVARGIMNLHGQDQSENPARLRTELDEVKRDVEIAVRLRAEAEAARDRLVSERDQLRSQLSAAGNKNEQLFVPVAEKQPAVTQEKSHPALARDEQVATSQDSHAGISPVQKGKLGPSAAPRSRWPGPVIGLGVSGIIALVIWLMLGTENTLLGDRSAPPQPDELISGDAARTTIRDKAVASEGNPARMAKATPQESVKQADTAVTSESPVEPARRSAEKKTVAPQVSAVRSFRDALKGGDKGPVMMELPAATYKMGSLGNSLNYDESPRHKVNLPGFSISKYEVTFAEYDAFARATGRRSPYDENWGRGNRPVVNVSWKDAVAYTEWLSSQTGKDYRLPTEAEWEYAVRAGGMGRYWWDNEAEGVYANCFNCGSDWDNRQTSPVGSFPANRFGLHDMAGNVQEWTQDCYQTGYNDAPADGSAWLTPLCTQRSVRGGGYTSPLDTLRSARRGQYDQDTRLDNIGFRVARSN